MLTNACFLVKNVPVDFECDVDEPGGTMFINKNSNPPLIHYEGPAAGSLDMTTVAVLYRDAKTNELDKRTVLLH